MINDEVKAQIIRATYEAAPNEVCGFIVDGQLMPCENIHDTPETHFAISAEDYAKAEAAGTIDAVYHSHGPDSPQKFSGHDAKSCRQINIPWLLFCSKTGNFIYADPTGNAPYQGRQWVYGVQDCYALVRDFYRREFGIVLDDFERGEELEWESKDWQMFGRHYASQGFTRIDQPMQKGDILLMQIDAPCPNHVGVMAGDGMLFYHHLMDRLSEQSIYGGMWSKVTSYVLRHKEL